MNSAWAMLVWLIAVKKRVMFKPKNSPAGQHPAPRGGRRRRATRSARAGRRSRATTAPTAPIIRQNATTEPGASAHLTIDELLEKARTAPSTQAMPTTVRSGVRVGLPLTNS